MAESVRLADVAPTQRSYDAPVPADVAQLVERLLAMQKVEGSSPFIRSSESPA